MSAYRSSHISWLLPAFFLLAGCGSSNPDNELRSELTALTRELAALRREVEASRRESFMAQQKAQEAVNASRQRVPAPDTSAVRAAVGEAVTMALRQSQPAHYGNQGNPPAGPNAYAPYPQPQAAYQVQAYPPQLFYGPQFQTQPVPVPPQPAYAQVPLVQMAQVQQPGQMASEFASALKDEGVRRELRGLVSELTGEMVAARREWDPRSRYYLFNELVDTGDSLAKARNPGGVTPFESSSGSRGSDMDMPSRELSLAYPANRWSGYPLPAQTPNLSNTPPWLRKTSQPFDRSQPDQVEPTRQTPPKQSGGRLKAPGSQDEYDTGLTKLRLGESEPAPPETPPLPFEIDLVPSEDVMSITFNNRIS